VRKEEREGESVCVRVCGWESVGSSSHSSENQQHLIFAIQSSLGSVHGSSKNFSVPAKKISA